MRGTVNSPDYKHNTIMRFVRPVAVACTVAVLVGCTRTRGHEASEGGVLASALLQARPWLDSTLPAPTRVAHLMAQMTTMEKQAQVRAACLDGCVCIKA